ncbi:hypothetical protein OKW34_001415 [Paraburkholderia youngii]
MHFRQMNKNIQRAAVALFASFAAVLHGTRELV